MLNDELETNRAIYEKFLYVFKKYGYFEISTSAIQPSKKYLEATKVHYSKIFEVHRVKEKSVYALQSDLSMSMSKYVAESNFPRILKLMQIGTLFRDRIYKLPNYRREF